MGEEMIILSVRLCGTSRVLLHAVKFYDMGPYRFTSHPRRRCAANFYRPQPLVLVTSTLTTTPPRRLDVLGTCGLVRQVSFLRGTGKPNLSVNISRTCDTTTEEGYSEVASS
jgi:hypothetical protein